MMSPMSFRCASKISSNKPFGNSGYQAWTADTPAAIVRLRDAGFDHTIMVDGPNWG
jgi:mannan endo-1,4-beta-mannosidase